MPSCHRSRAAILVALFVCLSCGGRRDARETAAERALAEFAGSYPAEVAPTGVIRSYDVVAAPAELPLVDGKTLKVWAYNGQVPGPTLRVRLGETLRVRFTNHLPDETTIHWHGVRLPNAMDGVPGLTQPAVAPGATFTYEFTPKDAGTFWFHPHVRASEQVERGLYGVLIVEDAEPPPYTSETIWVLDDWRLDATGQIDPNFNTRHDLAMDGRWGGAVTVNGRTDTTVHVRPGERVRVRMLDSANGRVFAPDFGGLHADVIAVDGLYLRAPVPAVGFQLAPGNRLDVDLVFDQSPAGPVEVWDRYIPQRPNRLVTIVVDGDLVDTPRFASPAHGHVPRWRDALDAPIAHTFRLNASSGGPFGITWTIDGVAFAGHEHTMAPAVTLVQDRFSRLHFVNESPRIHPIHFHGMFFRLLARNDPYGKVVNSTSANRSDRQQIALAYSLRHATAGWTSALHHEFFSWFPRTHDWQGGASFGGFISNIRTEALANVADSAERTVLSNLSQPRAPRFATTTVAPKGPGRNYTVAETVALIGNAKLTGRNFTQGRGMFTATACIACHRLGSEGGTIGPDLTVAGSRYSLRDLLENIIEPSKVISDQYGSEQLTLKNGDTLAGRVVSEDADALQILTNPFLPEQLTNIPKGNVQSRAPYPTSMMPPGLLNALNVDEVQDLLAYVLSGGNRNDAVFQPAK